MRFEDKDYIILEDADRWIMPNFRNPGIHWDNAGVVKAQLATTYGKMINQEFDDFDALREAVGSMEWAFSLYVGIPETTYIKRQQIDLDDAESVRKALDFSRQFPANDSKEA